MIDNYDNRLLVQVNRLVYLFRPGSLWGQSARGTIHLVWSVLVMTAIWVYYSDRLNKIRSQPTNQKPASYLYFTTVGGLSCPEIFDDINRE